MERQRSQKETGREPPPHFMAPAAEVEADAMATWEASDVESPNRWLLCLSRTRRGGEGVGGGSRKRHEGGVRGNNMWEGIQDTEASAWVLWKQSMEGTISVQVRGGVTCSQNVPPDQPPLFACLKWFSLPLWLGDFTAPEQTHTHTEINTHTKTHKSVYFRAHVYRFLACSHKNGKTAILEMWEWKGSTWLQGIHNT